MLNNPTSPKTLVFQQIAFLQVSEDKKLSCNYESVENRLLIYGMLDKALNRLRLYRLFHHLWA